MPLTSSVAGVVAAGLLAVGAVVVVPGVGRAPAGPTTRSASAADRIDRAGATPRDGTGPMGAGDVRGRAGDVRGRAGVSLTAPARFGWPLSPMPRVLRRFAVGPHPWSAGHRGVDLAAVAGQPVLAAGPGVVTFAGRVAGRGVVVVAHLGGLRTTYEPVAAGLGVGRSIVTGTRIGTVEDGRGHCADPCLHWGALRGDVYVDPLSLLGPPPLPVLLPDVESVS